MQEDPRKSAGENEENSEVAPDADAAGSPDEDQLLLLGYEGVETTKPEHFCIRLRRNDGQTFDVLLNVATAYAFGERLELIAINMAHGKVGG